MAAKSSYLDFFDGYNCKQTHGIRWQHCIEVSENTRKSEGVNYAKKKYQQWFNKETSFIWFWDRVVYSSGLPQTHSMTEANLEVQIFPSLPLQCYDYRHTSRNTAYAVLVPNPELHSL